MSLRARLLVGMALIVVVLASVGLAVTRATEANLVRQVDQQLDRAVPKVRERYKGRPGPGDADDQVSASGASSLYVGTVSQGVLVTLSLPELTEDQATAPDLTAAEARARVGEGAFTVGADGSDLRYRVIVRATGDGDFEVYASPLEDVDATTHRLIAFEVAASAGIVAVLGLVTFWVLRLGVRPVKQMTATAAAIGSGDLSRRIPESAAGTEAGELGVALNQMLGRIEESFDERARSEDRLRQFVADASHELRTPVTTIRGYAELYRVGGLRGEADLDGAMRRTEQEAIRMGALVEDLLNLARLDQGRPLHLQPVDLSALVADAARDAGAVEPRRPITVHAPTPVPIVGDDAMLRQIVANLVANARVHTPPDTPIHLRAGLAGDRAVVEVADEGPGMSPEVAARAFERFYRADPARTRHTGGSGLGLSIVAASAAAHGGEATLDSAPGRGTTVRLTLPILPVVGAPSPGAAGGGERIAMKGVEDGQRGAPSR
ncbi:HAMP domain-containing histidine kinase [Aquihabitans sp. G128]|uniref:sensor histidine kinase n=1 Tax=Aquihabitans sp. G128 TaxID=2849779 RepID=UPI001C238A49|nr:HAMP domain-containing sensor histidine kinase [Aquihabitans sp. G128]QXC62766.1 HAMP domain-containing histidine kinase [Aquihabitans sp. G128]